MSEEKTVGADFPKMVYAEHGGESDGTPFGESRIVKSPEELDEAFKDGFGTADEILEGTAFSDPNDDPPEDAKEPEGEPSGRARAPACERRCGAQDQGG